MLTNRKAFFDHVRHVPFDGFLTSAQVDGMTKILDEWDRRKLADMRWLAYMLATVFHETGRAMQPIREGGGDAYLRGKKYYPWYGRGLVQCTWDFNYRKFGCLSADDMLTWPFALRALFDGMIDGVFTGSSLGHWFTPTTADPVNARRIINGTDKASLIAGYYSDFLIALRSADVPLPVSVTSSPSPVAVAAPRQGFWAMLIKAFTPN